MSQCTVGTDSEMCICVHIRMHIYVVWNRKTETCVSVCISMHCVVWNTLKHVCLSAYVCTCVCSEIERQRHVCLHAYVCTVYGMKQTQAYRSVYVCMPCVIWNRKRQNRETRWLKPDLNLEDMQHLNCMDGFTFAFSSPYYITKLAASAF